MHTGTSIGALKSRNGPFLRKNIFVTFSYINVWVNFDPDFPYLISYLNFLYIFDDVITNFWHPFWNASRHPYTKILVWACSLDSLDAFWYPRLVVWPTESDIMEFAVIVSLSFGHHMHTIMHSIAYNDIDIFKLFKTFMKFKLI